MTTIEVSFRETSFQTRRRCAICGYLTDKDEILAVFMNPLDDEELIACHECVSDGVETFPAKLHEFATRMEAIAEDVKRLAGYTWKIEPLIEEKAL